MKTMRRIFLTPLTIMICLLLRSSESCLIAQQNIVQNGSFEDGWQFGPTGWGWTYNVGLLGEVSNAADGAFVVNLYGSLYQDLQTLPGQQYNLRFALAGNLNISDQQVVNVLWGGVGVGNASWSPVGNNINDLGWIWSDIVLTATASRTRLTFDNPYAGDGSQRIAVIDGISVKAVPEPPGLLLGGLAAFALLIRWRVWRQ